MPSRSQPRSVAEASHRIFEAAMESTRDRAREHRHGGDSEVADIAGAHAAGMRGVLIRRSGNEGSGDADAVIAALRELPGALRNMGLYSE